MTIQSLREAKLIAHRGAAAYAPENTLSAFRKAHELGATWVEFDVMLTRDGVPIIIHDETVDRTTNGTGAVADYYYEDIAKLDAGSWFSAQYVGERIPTFVETLNLLSDLSMGIEVEIKPTPGKGAETARAAMEALSQHWPTSAKPPLLSSADADAIATLAQLAPGFAIGSVVHEHHELADAFDSSVISVNQELLDQETITALRERYDVILPYTLNDRERAEHLLGMGVDAVFTDYPDLLHK